MKIKSIKTKVLLWFGIITFLILVLFSLSFRYLLNQNINTNLQAKLHQEALDLLYSFKSNKTLPNYKNIDFVIIRGNKKLYESKKLPLKQWQQYQKHFYTFENTQNDETIDALYILRDNNYTLFLYKSFIDNKIENFDDTLLVLVPIVILLLIFLASKSIDKVLEPIKTITKSARDISINNFSKKIALPKEKNEIKDLVLAFNEMIERLQEGISNLDRFNSDVSHELKTPLTVIKGEIEVTLKKLREPKEYINSFHTIYYEATQLEQIVKNLLLLTKYTKENIASTFTLCTFDTILLNCIEKFDSILEEKNITLHIERLEHIQSYSNQILLEAIFNNLIDNAIKYSIKNSNIYISLYQENSINFIIKDEGIGIAKDELSKITNRFYRVDKSRNKNISGFGLGLAIVENSINLLGGEFKINSEIGKGTTIFLVLKFIQEPLS